MPVIPGSHLHTHTHTHTHITRRGQPRSRAPRCGLQPVIGGASPPCPLDTSTPRRSDRCVEKQMWDVADIICQEGGLWCRSTPAHLDRDADSPQGWHDAAPHTLSGYSTAPPPRSEPNTSKLLLLRFFLFPFTHSNASMCSTSSVTHKLTHYRHSRHRQFGVEYLAQGHFGMWNGGNWDYNTDQFSGWPTLSPEPQLPVYSTLEILSYNIRNSNPTLFIMHLHYYSLFSDKDNESQW